MYRSEKVIEGKSEKDSSLIHITADAEVLGASYMRDEEEEEKNPEEPESISMHNILPRLHLQRAAG